MLQCFHTGLACNDETQVQGIFFVIPRGSFYLCIRITATKLSLLNCDHHFYFMTKKHLKVYIQQIFAQKIQEWSQNNLNILTNMIEEYLSKTEGCADSVPLIHQLWQGVNFERYTAGSLRMRHSQYIDAHAHRHKQFHRLRRRQHKIYRPLMHHYRTQVFHCACVIQFIQQFRRMIQKLSDVIYAVTSLVYLSSRTVLSVISNRCNKKKKMHGSLCKKDKAKYSGQTYARDYIHAGKMAA